MRADSVTKMGMAVGLIVILGIPLPAGADEPQPEGPPLLSHDELEKRLSDPALRLLDARPKPQYEKGHIPGAVWADVRALQALTKAETLADQAAWERWTAPLAIGPESKVFAYDGNRQYAAGRVWWLLGYAGVPEVGLIDGGFALWEKAGRPVTSEKPSVSPSTVAVKFNAKRIANRDAVAAASKRDDVQIIDARPGFEYRGEAKPNADGDGSKSGHIPSAHWLEASKLVDADGRFIGAEAARELVNQAGVKPDLLTIVYSQAGATSSLEIFALKRLGFKHVKHYQSGLPDWSRDDSLPVLKGDQPGRFAK